MRVFHIGKYYPPYHGGMENFLRDLLKAQVQRGMEAMALVHHHIPGQPSSSENRDGVCIVRASTWGQILYVPLSPMFPWVLKQTLSSFRPDILHLHLPNPSVFWCLLLAGARKVPWVVQWQSDMVPSRIDPRLKAAYKGYRPLEQALLKRVRRVIVASPDYLASSLPLRKWLSKCGVVPLGIDPERLPWPSPSAVDGALASWGGNEGVKILCAGRLTYYKGLDVLIRAARLCEKVTVQIVGKGVLQERLQDQIVRMGLEERVFLRGSLLDRDLHALFVTCDAVCLPSLERSEAFGIVLLEAMRFGKAVVVSDIPGSGAGWVVRKGEGGLLVPPGDALSLAKAFDRLDRESGLGESLGVKGKEGFWREFHIGSVAAKTEAVYREALEESGFRPWVTGS